MPSTNAEEFCDRRPKRPFLQKIAPKISGLGHAWEEGGGEVTLWGIDSLAARTV